MNHEYLVEMNHFIYEENLMNFLIVSDEVYSNLIEVFRDHAFRYEYLVKSFPYLTQYISISQTCCFNLHQCILIL